MSREVRVGIVGMGIGRPNAQALHADPRGRVVALCDLEAERMEEFERELKPGEPLLHFSDYRAMCRDENIDAVFVGTPNQLHVPVALEAIRAGKHVLVTKPLADSLEPARQVVREAAAAGVVNMMSLSTRFGPAARFLQSAATRGDFGELYYARARSVRRSGIPDWNLGFVRAGGGAFRDMGVHVLDAAWAMLGMPRAESATGVAGARFGPRGQGFWDFKTPAPGAAEAYASDDYAGGFIRFEGGAGLQVESFWACHQPEDLQIELFGSEAGARLSPLTIYKTQDGAPCDAQINIPNVHSGTVPWANIASHFIACILDGVPCEAPLAHGLAVQEMMEAVLQSAQTGREVRLDS
jgi:predicted dehydrogenase